MKNISLLVHGSYGAVGDAGRYINAVTGFQLILSLSCDGTPEGFSCAYGYATAKLESQQFDLLCESLKSHPVDIDIENRTVSGVPAKIQWMTVIKEWSSQ